MTSLSVAPPTRPNLLSVRDAACESIHPDKLFESPGSRLSMCKAGRRRAVGRRGRTTSTAARQTRSSIMAAGETCVGRIDANVTGCALPRNTAAKRFVDLLWPWWRAQRRQVPRRCSRATLYSRRIDANVTGCALPPSGSLTCCGPGGERSDVKCQRRCSRATLYSSLAHQPVGRTTAT
jgi:hypothetical protein